ncbi:MAG: glycosyltransferase family 4 protein [Deltaproteobacteria bacterium]|nr:glycosyltransferase family 4 protein [Deltaproteobacteria bacterium]
MNMLDDLPRIALVVPSLESGNGVRTVAMFLYKVIRNSGRYRAEFISLATSSKDKASVRLLAPRSWLRGPRVIKGIWGDIPFRHVGAYFTEFEFQRYRPRRVLTALLNKYDLVQVVTGIPPVVLVTRGCDVPVALQVATLTAKERSSRLQQERSAKGIWLWLMTKIMTVVEQSALRLAQVIFVENQWMYKHASREIGSQRVIFAPPGVDTDYFNPTAQPEGRHLISVGRFSDPRKNVRMLFEAYSYLRQLIPHAPRLILAGHSVPSLRDLSLAKSLGILDHIEVRQNVSMSELAELYRHAAVFVLSSNEEGLGIVILEAMSSGIPVVSTRCGGPETAVIDGETGYPTAVGNAREMATKIQELLASPALRERMGKAGRELALKHYSLEVAGRPYLEYTTNF